MMLNLNLKYAACVIALSVTAFFGWVSFGYAETDQAQTPVFVNGLNTTALNGLVDMLKKNPDKGRVTFYSKSRWQDGMRSFTGFTGYKIDGTMVHEKTREFVLLGDESVELSGTDAAPGAVEELMYAVATCVIAASNLNAASMGVKLTRIDVDIESDLDLHGAFALDPKVRPGLTELRMKITIAGDADEETLKKIATLGYEYSPVSETTRNGIKFTPVITVAK
ncbi:MAG TPA: OsmC family protein [Thermodesulfobacteriota bacterium]|nr:OsmC family protein [Thermodesulfobacteriota bacterium]